MDDLFEFRWDIKEGGYKWLTVPMANRLDQSDCFLTSGQPIGVPQAAVQYSPLHKHSGLFRHFAASEPNQESIREFANTYGLLGGDVSKGIIIPGKGSLQSSWQTFESHKEGSFGTGETLDSWTKEIVAMRRALRFWDWVATKDKKKLSQYVKWSAPDVVHVEFPEGGYNVIAAPLSDSHRLKLQHIPSQDVVQPALCYVQETTKKHLEGRVSPRLLWDKDWSRLGLYFVPTSLIGALWLQFARAVDGNKKYGRCQECQTWFEFSPDVARTNRRYCKDACRFKAYRRRQSEAKRLYAEGTPVEKIAAQLKSTTATIKSWIARQ